MNDDGQRIVLSILFICSASLSILGSGTLVFKILRDRANNGFTTFNRIMLGLSACDILASITWAISNFLFPRGRHVWSFGNATTCQAIGFLTQLSLSAWWYNVLLSYFFLLMVLSKVKKKNYARQFEPWLHITAAFWPITAIAGVFLGWFGEDSSNCWIADEKIGWIVGGFPTLLVYLSIIVNYGAIYAIVRKSLRSSERGDGSESVRRRESVPRRIEKEATTLMILYIAGFVVCVTPTVVLNILEVSFGYARGDSKVYPLRVWESIVLPIQGFFNFLIYIKPVYKRFRAAHPKKSQLFVLKQAILKSKAPPLQHRRVANHVTHGSDVLINDITVSSNEEMDPNETLFYTGEMETLFSTGQLFSSTDFNDPQLHNSSNQPETNTNSNEEEQA